MQLTLLYSSFSPTQVMKLGVFAKIFHLQVTLAGISYIPVLLFFIKNTSRFFSIILLRTDFNVMGGLAST